MKILIINNLYPPYHRGGAEVAVENQAKKLMEAGNQVAVVTTRPLFKGVGTSHGVFSSEKDNNIINPKIIRFYPWNIFSIYHINQFPAILRLLWHGIDMFNLQSYVRIKKILRQEQPEIVYVHNLTGIGYLIPGLIKKIGIKYIQVMHDVALIYPSGLLIKGQENCFLNQFFLTKLRGRINRYLFNTPDEVRFPSDWLRRFYQERGFFKNSECKVVRNFSITESTKTQKTQKAKLLNMGIHMAVLAPLASAPPLARGGVGGEVNSKVNLLYVGQIEEHKGILFLIRAISELRVASCELRIVGNGSMLQSAKKLAKDNKNIKFYGRLDKAKIQQLFKQIDYLIVPSLCYENSPTVIFESLSAGVPVVASNIGGIPELIQDGVNGYLFEAGDEDSLLKILVKLTKKKV